MRRRFEVNKCVKYEVAINNNNEFNVDENKPVAELLTGDLIKIINSQLEPLIKR